MRSASMPIIAAIIFFVSLTALGQTTAPFSSAEQWEYKITPCFSEPELNKLGVQGWELVFVHQVGGPNCSLYFKRPKGQGAYLTPPPPPPPPAPTCNLTKAQAPVIHGIPLGMSIDELLAVFPRSKEQNDTRSALAKADVQYGSTSLYLSRNSYPDSKAFVNNLESYRIGILDGRVNSIDVNYSFPGNWNWDGDTWIDKISESLNLPTREKWPGGKYDYSREIVCQGFSVQSRGSGSDAYISINATTPHVSKVVNERRNLEAEKRRREFIP